MRERIVGTCSGIKCSILRSLVKRQLFAVILYWIFSFGEILWAKDHSGVSPWCNIIKAKDIVIADCSSKGLTLDIPQDLEENIKVFNLSRNSVKNITERSFEKYKDTLTTLDLSYLNRLDAKKLDYSTETFSPLSNLQYLDLTNSCWSKNFVLPPKIKILKIENCSVSVSLADLSSLEELYAAGNAWTHSPEFHRMAPLKFIDLRRNALFDFDVVRIAPFCELRTVRMDSFPSKALPREFHNATTYCACKSVDVWLSNVNVDHDHLDCVPPVGFNTKCDVMPSESVLRLRRECLARTAGRAMTSMKTNWLMITVIIVIVLCLLIPTIVVTRQRLGGGGRRRGGDADDESEEEEQEEEGD